MGFHEVYVGGSCGRHAGTLPIKYNDTYLYWSTFTFSSSAELRQKESRKIRWHHKVQGEREE